MGGLSLPLTLTPGQKTSFSVVFAPASTGNMTGSVSLVSNALNSTTTIALSGTGVQPLQPQLSVIPPSASFGDVAVGTRNSQTITLINSGTGNVTISQATPSGNGFSMTGLTVPLTLSAGQRTSFNAAFAPASAGSGGPDSKFLGVFGAHNRRHRPRQCLAGQQCHQLAHHRAVRLRCPADSSGTHSKLESQSFRACQLQRLPWHTIGRAVPEVEFLAGIDNHLHGQQRAGGADLLLCGHSRRFAKHGECSLERSLRDHTQPVGPSPPAEKPFGGGHGFSTPKQPPAPHL